MTKTTPLSTQKDAPRQNANNISKNKDYIDLIVTVSLILVCGITIMCSVTPIMAEIKFSNAYIFIIKHLVFIFIGILFFLLTGFKIDYKKYQGMSKYIYVFAVLSLITPLIFGEETKGAVRWIQLGPLNFQPSEFAKIALIIIMADFLARKKKTINVFKYNIIPILYLGVMVLFIAFQRDLGTNVLLTLVWLSMFIVAGLNFKKIFIFVLPAVTLFTLLIVTSDYRTKRIIDYVKSINDISLASYNVKASLVAFGSGGLFGKGPGQSEMKLLHLPEMHTDFIFPIIGEEFGLMGTLVIIYLFISLFKTGKSISGNCNDEFGKYLSFGIITMITCQSIINIAMTIGLLPAKGLPLPFISYGGSSMLFSMIMVGILFNIARSNKKQS